MPHVPRRAPCLKKLENGCAAYADAGDTTVDQVDSDHVFFNVVHSVLRTVVCVGQRGIVLYDLNANHIRVSNHESQIIDGDMWRFREWYNMTVSQAIEFNRYLVKRTLLPVAKQAQFSKSVVVLKNIRDVLGVDEAGCCWWNSVPHPWAYMQGKFPQTPDTAPFVPTGNNSSCT